MTFVDGVRIVGTPHRCWISRAKVS